MSIEIFQVDAFTAEPFRGNPAAVCPLAGPANPAWMQAVAAEMNLSETAFIHPEGDGFRLRWFTPAAEVDLCGHATLATAHVLWETSRLAPDEEARFHTASGLLTARQVDGAIELNFPATPPEEAEPPAGLLEALHITPSYVGRSRFDVVLEVADEATLRNLQPDFGRLRQVDARGIIVTSCSDDDRFHFVSRFFGPAVGVDEDPVTGSAHCCLAPYWQQKLGRDEMVAYQASPRGGTMTVRVAGDRVFLRGQATTVLRGHLLVEPPTG